MRSRTPLLLVLLALVAGGCAQTPQDGAGEPLRVLFVGNSLTQANDLPAAVATLAGGSGTELEPDGFHPSPLGTYLAALVVVAGLAGQQPPAVPFAVHRPGFDLTVSATRTAAR